MTETLGTVLKGDVIGPDADSETVRLFCDVEDDLIYVRRGYGGRNLVLTLHIDDVYAALEQLRLERLRNSDDDEEDLAPVGRPSGRPDGPE